MIHWYDITRVLMIVFLVLTLIYLGQHFWPKTAVNTDSLLTWASIRHEAFPYLPGNNQPTNCTYTYMSPIGGEIMCMIDTKHMTLAITAKHGIITSTAASLKGYVTLGDIALVEGGFVQEGNSYKWDNLTAHTFNKQTGGKMFRAVRMISFHE